MKVLYNTESQAVFAYPRADDEPVVGLDPIYLVLVKIETPAPSPTAVPTWEVDLDALEYRQSWTEPEPPPPEPDWTAFIVEFSLPGNFLYNATATKVQASGEVTKEHWSNLKLGLNISEIRSIEWLQLSYNYLLYLLEVNNQALTIEEKQAWLDMANKHNITIE